MKILVSSALAGVIAISGAAYVYASITADPAAKACESAIRDRLVSPTSYRRASISESTRAQTKDEYLSPYRALKSSDNVIRMMSDGFDKMQPKPNRVEVSMEYDAANSYGAIVRGRSDCVYLPDSNFASIN